MVTRLVLVIALIVAATEQLSAATIPLTLDITDGSNVDAISIDAEVVPGFFSNYQASGVSTMPVWEIEWKLFGQVHNENVNYDDLLVQLRIRNNAIESSTFVISARRPVSDTDRVDLYGGGFTGSWWDLNGDGATLSTVGEPLYMSLIDGADFVPVLAHPFSATVEPNTHGTFTELGFPNPMGTYLYPGPTAVDHLGLKLEFQLTPGDEFRVMTHVGMQHVPEPTAHWLAAIGLGFVGCALRFCRKWPAVEKRRCETGIRNRRGIFELFEPRLPLSAALSCSGNKSHCRAGCVPSEFRSCKIALRKSRSPILAAEGKLLLQFPRP